MTKYHKYLTIAFALTAAFCFWQNGSTGAALTSAQQDTAIAVQMNAQGITGFGTPDVVESSVPMQVSPGCAVDFTLNNPQGNYSPGHASVTIYLPYHDAGGKLIGDTDTITDAASAAAVQKNLAAMLKADPKNQICR